MRIAIDAHMVGARETGNETYALGLIRGLLNLPFEARADLDLRLLTAHPERLVSRLGPEHRTLIRRVRPESVLRIPFSMPLQTLREGIDLLHVTYVAPPIGACPYVPTVHDISYEFFPQFFPPHVRWMLRTLVPLTMRRAPRIITVSEHARREIAARYRLPLERIVVTYEAADERYSPVTDVDQLAAMRARYGLGARYLLALGNLQPRKNLARLVEAYADLRRHNRLIGVQLVLAGKAQWRESELFGVVARNGLIEDVLFPGYIDDADLPALYSGAEAFVYPSIYEGFGLPPLEAMACGTPVVCSNAASLPEVVGDAALMIEPHSTVALAEALLQVTENPGCRADLVSRGRRRVAKFTWRSCAEQTLAVYRSVLHHEVHPRHS